MDRFVLVIVQLLGRDQFRQTLPPAQAEIVFFCFDNQGGVLKLDFSKICVIIV